MDKTDHRASDAEFTEANYARLLAAAARRYRFCNYGESASEPIVVWRHDIDFSPNRALALARIEAELGVKCVYHVMLSSRHYNVFELETLKLLRGIATFGHLFGLHFDMDIFDPAQTTTREMVDCRIKFEKSILENLLEVTLGSMSFHNTVLNSHRVATSAVIAGMINVNCKEVFDSYKYVSDSNGIWRRERLEAVLEGEIHPRLHVLTHPVWWTPEAMSPAERLWRAQTGRARAGLDAYFSVLARDGRAEEVLALQGFGDFEPQIQRKATEDS